MCLLFYSLQVLGVLALYSVYNLSDPPPVTGGLCIMIFCLHVSYNTIEKQYAQHQNHSSSHNAPLIFQTNKRNLELLHIQYTTSP